MVDKTKYLQTPIFNDDKYAFTTIKTDHRENNTRETCINQKIIMRCVECNLSFNNSLEFGNHHAETHKKKKMMTCNICTASFGRRDHLKRHMNSFHVSEKYCTCPVCGKNCKRKDILQSHIKEKHSDTTVVFNCRECEFQCNTLRDLERHESSHFLSERHVCEHCEVSFKRKDHMLRHVKSQHLNVVVSCPICGQCYKRRDHVARHVREKHKMGLLNGKLVTSLDLFQE